MLAEIPMYHRQHGLTGGKKFHLNIIKIGEGGLKTLRQETQKLHI